MYRPSTSAVWADALFVSLSTCSPRWSAEGEGLGRTRHRAPTCPSRPGWPPRVCGAPPDSPLLQGTRRSVTGGALVRSGPREGAATELEPVNWRCDVTNRNDSRPPLLTCPHKVDHRVRADQAARLRPAPTHQGDQPVRLYRAGYGDSYPRESDIFAETGQTVSLMWPIGQTVAKIIENWPRSLRPYTSAVSPEPYPRTGCSAPGRPRSLWRSARSGAWRRSGPPPQRGATPARRRPPGAAG
jgi:hypothetical protein